MENNTILTMAALGNSQEALLNCQQIAQGVVNVFDPSTVTAGYYIGSNGALTAGADFYASDYFAVDGALSECVSVNDKDIYRIAFYTSAKVFIERRTIKSGMTHTVMAPINAKYARVDFYSVGGTLLPLVRVYVGATASESEYSSAKKETLNVIAPPQKKLSVPDIHTIVGKVMRIYFDNIIDGDASDHLWDVTFGGTVSLQNGKYFEYTPSSATDAAISIRAYNKNNELVAYQRSYVYGDAASAGTGANRKVLLIGDSIVASGNIGARLISNFGDVGEPMDITLIGTLGSDGNLHEGRSGWTTTNYVNSDSVSSVTNPFRSGGAFNFSAYMSAQGYTGVDAVFVLLGANDVFSYTDDATLNAAIPSVIANLETMVASIRAYNANTKINICMPLPPNNAQDAFGTAYGCGQSRWRYKRNIIALANAIMAKFNAKESTKVYVVPTNVNIDCENNIEDGIHPKVAGANQIGDTMTYLLKYQET